MFHDFFCTERNRGLAFFNEQKYYELVLDRYEHEDRVLRDQILTLANITRLALDSTREINQLAHQLSPQAISLLYNAPPASAILIQLLDHDWCVLFSTLSTSNSDTPSYFSSQKKDGEALISIAYVKTWLEKIYHPDTPTTGYLPGKQCTTLIYRLYGRLTAKKEAKDEKTTQYLIEMYESFAEEKIIKDSARSLEASFVECVLSYSTDCFEREFIEHVI